MGEGGWETENQRNRNNKGRGAMDRGQIPPPFLLWTFGAHSWYRESPISSPPPASWPLIPIIISVFLKNIMSCHFCTVADWIYSPYGYIIITDNNCSMIIIINYSFGLRGKSAPVRGSSSEWLIVPGALCGTATNSYFFSFFFLDVYTDIWLVPYMFIGKY